MTRIRPFLAALLAAGAAHAAIGEPSGLAATLRASGNEAPAFMLTASGVHVYECRAVPGGYAWSFLNPDATLFEGTRSVATHATPSLWEATSDRSGATGRVIATQPAGPGNLPWTLYRAQSSGEGGIFSGVTSVQRVNTAGGVAPAGGCGDATVGTESRVAFTADYYFYKPRGAA
jgi:uncharacterized protein DUF3455